MFMNSVFYVLEILFLVLRVLFEKLVCNEDIILLWKFF